MWVTTFFLLTLSSVSLTQTKSHKSHPLIQTTLTISNSSDSFSLNRVRGVEINRITPRRLSFLSSLFAVPFYF